MVTIKDWHMINAIVKIIIQRNQRLQIYILTSRLLFIIDFNFIIPLDYHMCVQNILSTRKVSNIEMNGI